MKNKKLLTLAVLCGALLICGCGKTDTAEESKAGQTNQPQPLFYYRDALRYDNIYDAEGRVEERVCFNKDAQMASITKFSYQSDGTYIREYNNEYKLVSESFCTPNEGTLYSHIYKNGNECRYCYLGGVLSEKIEYKDGKPYLSTLYDADGKQTKSITYTADGGVLEYKLYSYNDAGKNTQIDIYDGGDKLKSSVAYEYTAKGYYSSVTTRNGKGEITARTEYVYDETGKQTAELVYKYEGGVAKSYEKWVTDEDGKRVLEGSYDA